MNSIAESTPLATTLRATSASAQTRRDAPRRGETLGLGPTDHG